MTPEPVAGFTDARSPAARARRLRRVVAHLGVAVHRSPKNQALVKALAQAKELRKAADRGVIHGRPADKDERWKGLDDSGMSQSQYVQCVNRFSRKNSN